ncbi:MAG: ATP synthase F1 subunit delta [Deltaproteobacteria bacterium]|nr:ATP synthase F1 subunit delta [Deltaproteobacteria bacterium]
MSKSSARRYAKALLDVGKETSSHVQFGHEIRDAAAVFKVTPELYHALLNLMYKTEERFALMDKVSSAVKLSQPVARFLGGLVSSRNIRLLDDIVAAYGKLEDEAAGRLRAVVESPVELSGGILDVIKEKLRASAGKDVALAFRLRPELIGGLVINIENTVFDGSIRTQLELMKEKIIQGAA